MTEPSVSPVFIRLRVEVLEDLRAGSGTGSGDIDALLERDRRGLPVIRDSHLKGLLREAGTDLIDLEVLELKELNALLGTSSGGRRALEMTSLRIPEEAKAETLVWGASARTPNSRAPLKDSLRYIEHVAAGTIFEAILRLQDPSYRPLLEQLLKRVDRMGGDRNRGSGLVKLDWRDDDAPAESRPTAESGVHLRLVLQNLEPLCLPATGHPGNLMRSHSFIRGQALRGAFLGWAVRNGRPPDLALFSRIAFGDALPLSPDVSQAESVIPIPLSILTDKPQGGSGSLPWWVGGGSAPSAVDILTPGDIPKAEEKRKRPGEHEYLCRKDSAEPWLRYTPEMRVRLRNATPAKNSQKDAELFSNEEIAEDTRFQVDLRFPDSVAARQFLDLFSPLYEGGDWLTIGRGGKPARIESIASQEPVPADVTSDRWTFTLTSDLILRGTNLGFLGDLSIPMLCRLAGIDEPSGSSRWHMDKNKQTVETQAVHGFNAVTGLRRASAIAIKRGSCWLIQGDGCAALAKALAAQSVLGERTHEGFGRFLINIQPIINLTAPPRKERELDENRQEQLRMLADKLASKIKDNGPSLSQLQWLRSHALAATEDKLQELLDEITKAPKSRPQGGKAWENFPIDDLKHALAKLTDLNEKRLLISYLVKKHVLFKRREGL